MRTRITRPEWDDVYYHSQERPGQVKVKNEPEAAEVEKVAIVLRELRQQGFLPRENYDLAKFATFRALVHENFFIYWTAINPPMERLLYALSAILQPRNILGIGIFTGNPLVWSLGPALDGSYQATNLAGVEINKNHARLCRDNMDQVRGPVAVTIFPEDGFDVIERYQDGEVDLLYLDANGYDPPSKENGGDGQNKKNTKNINTSLLKKTYAKIRPGGYAMCHNAYQPSFERDAADYFSFTGDETYFSSTVTIGIDEMGLEFSIKKK